ncbi:NACHT domain- and WD repeat-containing protein 1-like [Lingula anatina]|uniref:NACHT domain- and WD repeat-containing protein 1-like n=1 Tax=Lingula anatina TaxID=7574 RepID=A0A1S3H3P9_LINAN|nr:NACHT domain- and WD repeat-containing protein 1-like [Lingula anatina]|eukprot:XP_013379764.1 NACHT domain- and WD repeat-containing protein 1-like [Lingula anatina]
MLGPVSFSGPIRQLSNKAAPGKRRKATLLPGGKLKPLQKNVILQDESKSSSQALPGIGSAAARNLTEDQVKDVLAGHWDNIPPLPSKQIRIYLSSSPDMWQEREIILKEAVPQLQDYCIQRGFSFHLVDTRWEGPKEIFDDYHAQAMHLSELEKCQKVSVGPNFVILLGDKYGEVPFPHTIPEMDFEALRQAAKENQLPNADLLEKCFIKDINAVPPQYNLKFGFNGHQELDQESCLSDEDFEELQAFFKDTCRLAVKTEKMTRAREQWYFQSVVEKELVNGIVKAPSPENSTLCFRRDFKGVPKKLQQSSAARYFDVEEKFDGIYLNQEKYSAMVKVKSERLTPSYQTDNQKLYTLQWTEMGVDQHNPEHSKYLNQLCSDFVEEVTKLIDKNLTVLKKAQKYYTPVLEEVLHHAHVWKQKCSDFSGREEFLEKVHQQLMDSTSKLPLIIHSLSGEGKSSVVSMIHKNCGQWLGPKCVTITRYLGLMQGSSTVQELVTSLIAQICTVFNLKNMIEIQGSQSSLFKLLKTFHSTLKQVASKNLIGQDRHLVLILDGIDRLTPIEEALRALWVILDLPPFTHVIISTISERGSMNIIDLFKRFIPNESCYLGLPEVPDTEAEAILDANLVKAGRSVSSEQKEAIMQAFRENRNLFLLKLLLDKAKLWKSYTSPEFLLVTPDIDGAVLGGVELLELKHGSQLIKNVVSYITLSGLGVTEQELHDLLSCNDEVMQEVYELYAAPPLEGVVHFPSVLMVRLLHDIEAYLIYREADGHDIIGWSHQLLVENLSKVYGLIYPGILQDEIDETSVDFTLNIHEDFVQLYKAEATVKKTITIQDKTIPDARRLTVPRPLNAKNLRKLRKLPFHMRVLIPANESGRIKEEILCNFQWLLTKFKGTSVKEVLSDFESVLGIMKYLETMSVDETQPKMSAREDVEMIYSSLKAAMQALKLNPENLAAEILGRATAEAQEHPYIGLLMKGAAQWVEAANTPLIIPVCPCFPYKNNSGLQGLMVGPSVFIGVTGVQDNLAVTYNYSEGVELRSLDTGEALSVFPAPLHGVFADNPLANVALSEDGQLVLIKTHPREKTKFTVWSTSFGNKVKEMTFDFQVSSFAISRDAETIVLGTHDGTILGIALHTGEESFSLQGAESSATITNIALDEVSGKIVATGQDLYVWDMPTLTLEHAFLLDGEVKCGLMKICSSSGRVVCGVSSTGTVIVASYNNGQILDTIESRTYRDMRDILIGAEGFYVIIATWNLGVDIWSVEPAQCVKSIDYPEIASDETDSDKDSIDSSLIEYIPSKVAIDHNELFLFVGFEHGEVAMYYIPTGEVVKLLMHGVQSVTNVSLFKEEFLFSSCNDGTIKRWHVKDLMTQTINRYGHSADTFAEQSPLEMHVASKPNPTESGGGTGSGEDSFYPTEDEAVREIVYSPSWICSDCVH